ncbi:MAG: P-II family nitrogen regulator [Dehalococcoidia bacterium]|nr:P-II family nitrogen regulator [Dehalococcoidia bacterium]
MVKIEAIVRPERINLVVSAIEAAGCRGYHFENVTGRGQQGGIEVFTGRGGATTTRTALPKTLLVTVVEDKDKDKIVKAIIDAARSSGAGAIGDGKIFISPVSEVIRVRTGEKNSAAL